jgi:hypothetical protein
MYVKIGPYKNWFGPHQLAEYLCFWAKPEKDKYGFPKKPDWVLKFGEWLAHGSVKPDAQVGDVISWNDQRHQTWLYRFLLWIDSKRERKIKIQLDPYDTWSMDNTLAIIILPMLKQLQRTKHGSHCVDDEDVPEFLCSTTAPPKQNDWDLDDNHHKRWDWVLDEMIWAFEQYNTDWESEYYSGETDFYSIVENSEFLEMNHGPYHTFKTNKEGLKKHSDRINNGLRLFGKYYRSLWD